MEDFLLLAVFVLQLIEDFLQLTVFVLQLVEDFLLLKVVVLRLVEDVLQRMVFVARLNIFFIFAIDEKLIMLIVEVRFLNLHLQVFNLNEH